MGLKCFNLTSLNYMIDNIFIKLYIVSKNSTIYLNFSQTKKGEEIYLIKNNMKNVNLEYY